MNNDQLKHIAAVLHVMAIGLFAVFGYTGLVARPVEWLQIGFAALGFLNIECLAVWILSYIRRDNEGGR
ncbi:hypothetical protein [Nitrosomonas sp. Is37]|uniref:hypothetical protein n=1 Tax=Nitrosomonas sp. Is37 TaxID=3080535 RepID=UPI00294AB81E|nr:hypothetical protein [Nitrosomonas sp. Is37]MDV6343063.1 hypothetical protein [Nitrosomonas sp. Is37]